MRSSVPQLSISLAILVGLLLTFEIGIRFFIQPADQAWGLLFGVALPPYRLVAAQGELPDPMREWTGRGKSNPEKISYGDLWGLVREDKDIGFTNQENGRSLKDWWQSNNIGARSRRATMPELASGQKRIFIFGESCGQGSRVPQEKAWTGILQARHPSTEFVNMSVDGYGMALSYLRYLKIKDAYQFTTAAFVFVPENDLWRDINTMRQLGESWEAYAILPRVIAHGDELEVIPGPYPKGSDIYKNDFPFPTEKVRNHLREYDRFYSSLLYEDSPIFGHFVLYKIFAKILGEVQHNRVYAEAKDRLDGEALTLDRTIFKKVAREMAAANKHFLLVLLPDVDFLDSVRAGKISDQLAVWNARAELLRKDGIDVLDLLPPLREIPKTDLDRGYDGTHLGPRSNLKMADLIEIGLVSRDQLK